MSSVSIAIHGVYFKTKFDSATSQCIDWLSRHLVHLLWLKLHCINRCITSVNQTRSKFVLKTYYKSSKVAKLLVDIFFSLQAQVQFDSKKKSITHNK